MTTNAFFSFGTKALVADGSAGARAELVRRGRCPETGKKVATGGKSAKAAASPAPEPAPAPESGDDLATMAWDDLRALGKAVGVKGRDRATLTERIRAAQASAPEPAPAPTGDDLDPAAIVAGVQRLADSWLAQRAEIARLKAQAAKPASGGDWLKGVASALKSTGHLSA